MNKEETESRILDGARFPRLSESQCNRIHGACLEILERVGVRLELEEAVDLLKKAGARVDEKGLVHVPHQLVEKALSTAPNKMVLHDREGRPVMRVEGHSCFYGPGSDCLNIIDHRTGERRKPILTDVIEGTTVCDALPNIDFVMSMVLPSDVNTAIADRHQMAAMLSHTTKPIVFVSYEFGGCVDAVEMAEAVAGGPEALERQPTLACYINVQTGLHHNIDALQKLLYLSAKNLPALYIPSSTSGVTCPMTPAGALAFDYAGVLLGVVLSQLTREGAPVAVPGMPPGPLDMRTMVLPYIEPERGHPQALAHHYGLPMFSLAGASESKLVDQQAAAEAALSLMNATLAGGQITHDLGYLESGLTYSLAQLAICDDIVSWLRAFGRGIEVDDESLALDVIAEVGPDGQFLHTEHTLKHFRERWYPTLFERDTYEGWLDRGGESLCERAVTKVDTILADHHPEPLPDETLRELQRIVQRAAMARERKDHA
jgi:trimethylamine--corrinoid protein Co-methyltransferase